MVAVLQIPPVTLDYGIITRAGILGSSAPDTVSDDETLGPALMEAVLPIPPVGLMY